MADNQRTLSREIQASIIPAGDAITLPEGTKVDITHRLGGNFTVVCEYGMFRINGKDADAIGEDAPEVATPGAAAAPADGPIERPSETVIWDALKTVYDPEIPVNIVDLGLVYSMEIKELGEAVAEATGQAAAEAISEAAPAEPAPADAWHVDVKMTLTAPGCGMGPVIAEDAKTRVETIAGVTSAQVDIVWDPPWDQSMISEEGKMELGLL